MMPKSSDVILLSLLFQAGVQPGQLLVMTKITMMTKMTTMTKTKRTSATKAMDIISKKNYAFINANDDVLFLLEALYATTID